MNLEKRITSFFAEIMREVQKNPELQRRLDQALGTAVSGEGDRATKEPSKRPYRRTPALFDPFEEFQRGEQILRERLKGVTLDQLKDIVAQYGMDRSKLAMKWKHDLRLIELIVATVAARAKQGDAFLPPIAKPNESVEAGAGMPDQPLIDFLDVRIAQLKELEALADAVMKLTTPNNLGGKYRILVERVKEAYEAIDEIDRKSHKVVKKDSTAREDSRAAWVNSVLLALHKASSHTRPAVNSHDLDKIHTAAYEVQIDLSFCRFELEKKRSALG